MWTRAARRLARGMWRHSFGKHHPENTGEEQESSVEEPASTVFNTASFGNFLEARHALRLRPLLARM